MIVSKECVGARSIYRVAGVKIGPLSTSDFSATQGNYPV